MPLSRSSTSTHTRTWIIGRLHRPHVTRCARPDARRSPAEVLLDAEGELGQGEGIIVGADRRERPVAPRLVEATDDLREAARGPREVLRARVAGPDGLAALAAAGGPHARRAHRVGVPLAHRDGALGAVLDEAVGAVGLDPE